MQLRACLEHVERLEGDVEWELIVIDNGSTDGTGQLLQEYANGSSFPFVVVEEPKRGLGNARNSGIKAAKGQILAFTDDDCYPAPDFLVQVTRVFEDEHVGYMGGRVLLYDPADAPITIMLSMDCRLIPPHSFVPPGVINGANMAVRRAVIDAVGMFDPMLGAGSVFASGEDCEYVARASAEGWTGGYFPEPFVYHHHGRRHQAEVDSLRRNYDKGRGAFYAKFLLRSDTRGLYARNWWWSIDLRQRPGSFAREVGSAVYYLLLRLIGRLHS